MLGRLGVWACAVGRAGLGQAEEQVLERRELRSERQDADAGLPERQRQRADMGLVGLQAEPVLAGVGVLDAVSLARDLERPLVVGGPQAVAGPALAAQVRERALVDDAAAVDDRDAVAQVLHLGELVA